MTTQEVERHIIEFVEDNPGLKGLKFKIAESMEHAFPQLSSDERNKLALKGGYYPASKMVMIIADKHKDLNDLKKTLKHEIYGHNGINHLSVEQKRQLLEKIISAPDNSEIGRFRDNLLKKEYTHLRGQSSILAEETFAHYAELLPDTKETFYGIPDIDRIESSKDLMDLARSIKAGIQSG